MSWQEPNLPFHAQEFSCTVHGVTTVVGGVCVGEGVEALLSWLLEPDHWLLLLTQIIIREFFRMNSCWSEGEGLVTFNGYFSVGEEVFWSVSP